MTEPIRRRLQLVVAGALLITSSVVCFALVHAKPVPPKRYNFERILEVGVAVIEPKLEQGPVVGYGTVRPRNQVEIVPLVSGRLTLSHKNLARGRIIPKGDVLFEIDPTVFESRVAQGEAEIRRLEASLDRHDQEQENLDERIVTATAMAQIAENDYLTSKRLYEVESVGTQRDLDQVHLKFLRQKDALAELSSRRSMVPHQKLDVQAQLDGARARLKQSRYDLDNTKITCPFEARVEAVHASSSQVVMAHLSIATLTDMNAFELSVGIDPRELRWLDTAILPEALESRGDEAGPPVNVRWSLHGQRFTWKGRVSRFEQVDERTRTAQMVVEIRNVDMIANIDYGGGDRGPVLSIGMFCSAELPARPLHDALLVPRHAIYDNQWVYVFEPDQGHSRTGRLERRKVAMLRAVGDSVLVDFRGRKGTEVCELVVNEQVVVSRLIKPVVGMKVRLRDEQFTALPRIEGTDHARPAIAPSHPFFAMIRPTHGDD